MAQITAVLIRNPAARRRIAPAELDAAVDFARRAGWDVTVALTERAGHATKIAREAARRDVDVIIVNGGDGTLNEVANGVVGTTAAVAVLPGGTANIWAKEAHIARDPRDAMRSIVDGRRRRIDLGRAGDRYFVLMAGVGLDAAILPRINPGMKRRLGAASYVYSGAITAIRTRPWMVRLSVDDRAPSETPLYWLLAGNTRSYGGLVNITDQAEADDGLLEVGIMHRGGLHLVPDGVRVLLRRHRGSPNLDFTRARSVEILTPGLPIQVDGEGCGATPVRIEVMPLALTVVVPAGLTTPLFGRPLEPPPA